jgi:N-acetylglutamate synthase-like GNAT family acetyltransferase
VTEVAVRSDCRRCGVAASLLGEAEALARGAGVAELYLHVEVLSLHVIECTGLHCAAR